jgi:hypothetical protein
MRPCGQRLGSSGKRRASPLATQGRLWDLATPSRTPIGPRIEPLLPGRPGDTGWVGRDNRRFLDAVL